MKTFMKPLAGALLGAVLLTVPNIAKSDSVAMEKVGIQSHFESYTDQVAYCDEIIASGIKHVRFSPNWDWLFPNGPGSPVASRLAVTDDTINRLSAAGVQVTFVLLTTARWATPPVSDYYKRPPTNWSDWSNFVTWAALRYNNKVTNWEVWNEPDYGFWKGTDAEYVTLLQTAAAALRSVNPNNKVLLGGLAAQTTGIGTFFDRILGLGAAPHFDIICYHSYDSSMKTKQLYDGMKAVIDKYNLGSRKIWITETGYSSEGDAAREKVKSDYIDHNIYNGLFAMDPNIEKVIIYLERNTIVPNSARESNFGMLTESTRTPLNAFYHYQALGGAETGFKMQKDYPTSGFRRTLNYVTGTTGDGKYVVDYDLDGSTKRLPFGTYMYFTINDSWIYNNIPQDQNISLEVTYLDVGTGGWGIQYDGTGSSYTTISQTKTNTGAWVTKTFNINDAKFANRENYTSDFRLYAPTQDLIVKKVAVRRDPNKGWAALGMTATTDQGWLVQRPYFTGTSGAAYCPATTMGGRPCREVTNSGFLYFDVAQSLVKPTDRLVTIGITFWDAGTDKIQVSYNAITTSNKNVYITKTNTNAWKTVQVVITDAKFLDTISNVADFWIANTDSGTEYINSVTVVRN